MIIEIERKKVGNFEVYTNVDDPFFLAMNQRIMESVPKEIDRYFNEMHGIYMKNKKSSFRK